MQNPENIKLLFVINPASGGKEKQDWEVAIRKYFEKRTERTEFFLLTGKDDETSVKYHIGSLKPDRVIAVGGDGTVKMIAEILEGTKISLGIVPAGSANGMAKELKIPDDVEEALKIITGGVCRKLDAIRINEKEFCLHLADIGLNALLVRYFEHSKTRGMWGYSKAVLRVLWEKQMMHVTINAGEKEVSRNAYMVVIANAQTYGTGAIINPNGKVDDGLFEIVVIRKLSLVELFKMLVSHKPFDPECIEVFQSCKAIIKTKRRSYFQVDGEYLGKTNQVTAEILPKAVFVMLPEEFDH